MTPYMYEAKIVSYKTHKGLVLADSRRAAVAKVLTSFRQNGYTIIEADITIYGTIE